MPSTSQRAEAATLAYEIGILGQETRAAAPVRPAPVRDAPIYEDDLADAA